MSSELQDAIKVLMKNAQKMMGSEGGEGLQQRVQEQQSQTVEARVGNLITVVANLKMEVTSIVPEPDFWNESQAVQLSLIVSGVNEALNKAKQQAQAQMGKMAQMMGLQQG